MFSSKSVNNKVLAVAFVSMLMICSLGMVFAEESDATYDESFDIHMREGDQFSYTPAVNLSNTTITPSGTALSNGLTNNSGTISGSFSTAGDYQLVLTATWTGSGLSQTATQTVNFHVYDRITFQGQSQSGNIGVNQAYTINELSLGETLYTAAVQSLVYPVAPTFGNATISNPEGVSENLFAFEPSTGAVTVARAATSADVGQYTLTIPATYSANGVNDSATITLGITVAEDLTITSPSEFFTFDGDNTNNVYTITSNGLGDVSYTATAEEAYQALFSFSGTTITVNTSAAGALIEEGEESMSFDITIGASSDVDSDSEKETATHTIHVTVYAGLEFTSTPSISNVSAQSATGNPLDVLATANFEGATKITYNWGDGTSTTVNVTPDSGSKFSARHVYSNAGTYAIAVTAENDQGNTKAIMIYDASNGAWAEGEVPEEPANGEQSFFEEHGILFLIFAILAIIMLVLFFFNQLAPYSLFAAVLFVILAVACFVTGDFGITEGLIKDLNI